MAGKRAVSTGEGSGGGIVDRSIDRRGCGSVKFMSVLLLGLNSTGPRRPNFGPVVVFVLNNY